MSNSHRIVILLTACVNPNGMSKTVLQDVELRRKQYVNALNFYLQETSLPICFVENTGFDMSFTLILILVDWNTCALKGITMIKASERDMERL